MSKHIKIKPSDTTVDPEYQRDFEEARAKVIAKDFSWDLFGVPVLSKRADGRLVRIDGQHRMASAIIAGHGAVPVLCEVHEGLSVPEEAALFLRLNGARTAVRVLDKFKARVVAKEPVAVDITAILKSLGLKVVKSSQRRGVQAVKAVETVYHVGNLRETMYVLTEWGDGEHRTYEDKLVRAVSSFLLEYPSVDLDEVASRLRKHAPGKVMAKIGYAMESFDLQKHEAACSVLREIYNAGRPQKKRLPPPGSKDVEPVAAE